MPALLRYSVNIKYVLERRENITENGENGGYQRFLLFPHYFPTVFSKAFLLRAVKTQDCVAHGRYIFLNSLPHGKILDQSKLIALANNKIIMNQQISFRKVENIVRKRENAGYQHFLLFQQCFQKLLISGSKSRNRVVKGQGWFD